MIIGLIGVSCCGKSFFLELLHKEGFVIPQHVTTREPRGSDELWQTKSVKQEVFDGLKESKRLCLMSEAYGNLYACLDFPSGPEDVAVLMRPENAEELHAMGGVVIYIKPFDNGYCERLMKAKARNNCQARVPELTASPNIFELARPDIVFVNRYDRESNRQFLKMIRDKRFS